MSTRDITHLTKRQQSVADGSFQRPASSFMNSIEKDGEFEPAKGRYHLYVSYACPWATRALIVRKLKGLEDIIDVSVVSPRMGQHGWTFADIDSFPGADADPINGAEHVKDLYFKAEPNYEGRREQSR